MRRLSFAKHIYGDTAVDEAVSVFERFGQLERSDTPTAWVVDVSCRSPARERQVAGELGNYTLGLAVKARGRK